jgi:hypothetical protein
MRRRQIPLSDKGYETYGRSNIESVAAEYREAIEGIIEADRVGEILIENYDEALRVLETLSTLADSAKLMLHNAKKRHPDYRRPKPRWQA